MSLIVYRVQDGEGRGPWKPGISQLWCVERDDWDNLNPWFIEFGNLSRSVNQGEVCGSACKTIEQLRRWFLPQEYKTLNLLGYRAVATTVDRLIAESDVQVVFAKKTPLNQGVTYIPMYLETVA